MVPSERKNTEGEIDRVIHEPARLKIVAQLYVMESADLLFLQRVTGLTWGNLSAHTTKLEEAGYVEVVKEFVGKKPRTTLKLTNRGRRAFLSYQRAMKKVLGVV